MEKTPTPPGVGASIKGGGQENELERTLPLLYYQIVLCTSRKRFEQNDLISARTKEGLAAAKASGKRLGRPKGPGKSKLDKFKPEIVALLKNGSKKVFIAERYGVTPATLTNWLKKHGLDKLTPTP